MPAYLKIPIKRCVDNDKMKKEGALVGELGGSIIILVL